MSIEVVRRTDAGGRGGVVGMARCGPGRGCCVVVMAAPGSLGAPTWTGRCAMPLMKFDADPGRRRRRSGRGRARAGERSISAISSRARWAPRQKCGPMPNATCGFGSRRRSRRVRVGEHRRVAVGRAEPDHDLVAGPDLLVAEHRVARSPCAGTAAPATRSAAAPRPRSAGARGARPATTTGRARGARRPSPRARCGSSRCRRRRAAARTSGTRCRSAARRRPRR